MDQGPFSLLRRELEQIGRNERSIKPGALAHAYCLHSCPATMRRVTTQATTYELLEAAHQAILDALNSLSTPDRLIGEAILASTPEYEGKSVDQRKRLLDEHHGIGENLFKRRRPHVLDAIVAYLSPTQIATATTDGPSRRHYQVALRDIRQVLLDGRRLADICRGCMFVRALNRALTTNNTWPPGLQPGNEKILLDAVYEQHMNLVVSGGYCFDDAPYSQRARIDANLPAIAITEIANALDRIYSCLPIEARYRRVFCEGYFGSIADLYEERVWQKGHRILWGTNLRLTPKQSDDITSGYGQLADVAREYLNMRVRQKERDAITRETSEVLARYYGISPDSPLNFGSNDASSLLAYLKHYFLYEGLNSSTLWGVLK
jgi:hypothetical protein